MMARDRIKRLTKTARPTVGLGDGLGWLCDQVRPMCVCLSKYYRYKY